MGATPQITQGLNLKSITKKTGISSEEFNELALYWMVEMFEHDEHGMADWREILDDYRKNYGQSSSHNIVNNNAKQTEVHPFMQRLFSGDLEVLHEAKHRELTPENVKLEHVFISQALRSMIDRQGACLADIMSELEGLELVIRHCPTLQPEAAAIRAMLEGEAILNGFCKAVDAA